jgi:RNA polymerase sigma-70 factor (family 1)
VEDLRKEIQNNSVKAFEELYAQKHARIYRFMNNYVRNKEEAQELTQQFFIRLWTKRYSLSAHKSLDGELFVIARNLVIDELRKKVRLRELKVTIKKETPIAENVTLETVFYHELNGQYEAAIEDLSPKRKEIYLMHRSEGKTYLEISKEKNISIKTVEAQMNKALKLLRVRLAYFQGPHL